MHYVNWCERCGAMIRGQAGRARADGPNDLERLECNCLGRPKPAETERPWEASPV
jgi:hypothetical protein